MSEAHKLTCGACGHSDDVPEDPKRLVLRCDECKTRIAYGVAIPRFVVEPCDDRRFVRIRVQSVRSEKRIETELTLDRDLAKSLIANLASIL